jgi:hypothetical protein
MLNITLASFQQKIAIVLKAIAIVFMQKLPFCCDTTANIFWHFCDKYLTLAPGGLKKIHSKVHNNFKPGLKLA